MNKRVFIGFILLVFALLAGWIFYISSQSKQQAPLEKISRDWWGSAHSDIASEAFTHWNEDEPAQVPPTCAKCHSGNGFVDFIGQDGSTEFSIDRPAAVESVVTCAVCHSEKADALDMVQFPSGVEINFNQGDALCATCHSGLTAGSRVDAVAGDFDADAIVPDGSFVAPHYYFSAATAMGSEAGVGYQYPDKDYVGQFEHANGVQTCTQCHDPHSLHMKENPAKPDANLCAACHSNVTGYADYREVFVDGIDYDLDGDAEGVYHEIEGLRNILMTEMQAYTVQEFDEGIGWKDSYPYLFVDTDKNGTLSDEEAAFQNAYKSFSPRLMRAAFNYQFSVKEPAGYVHNGKFVIQLVMDSITDLASVTGHDYNGFTRPASAE